MLNAHDCSARRELKVGGITPFSATDYPGQLAAVIFVQGCPLRCAYCHNPHLQPRTTKNPIPWDGTMEFLKRRIGLIDAVVFSGGEPTMDPALVDAILQVKGLGFRVGLHTAGCYPERLLEALPLLDWVALDIKAPFEDYQRLTGSPESGAQARRCVEAILATSIDYEFRTTVHSTLLPPDDLLRLTQSLAELGAKNYALQRFRSLGCADAHLSAVTESAYPSQQLVARIANMFSQFTFRAGI